MFVKTEGEKFLNIKLEKNNLKNSVYGYLIP